MTYSLLHYLHPVTTGGGEDLLIDLLNDAPEQSKKDTVVVLGCKNQHMEAKCKAMGVKVSRFPAFNSRQQYSKMVTLLRSPFQILFLLYQVFLFQPRIMHLHSFPMQYLGGLLHFIGFMRGRRITVGFTKHIYSERGPISQAVWKMGTRNLDFFSAVSHSALQGIGIEIGPTRQVIFNPADRRFFESNYKTNDTSHVRACIGSRIVSGKGHLELLDFLAKSKFGNKSLHLYIFGSGPLEKQCQAAAERAMLENSKLRVTFEGLVSTENLLAALGTMDFAFHPSQNEGFSLMCAQYHAFGMPTLCYDYGPSREVFEGRTEYFSSLVTFQKSLQHFLDYKTRQKYSAELIKYRDSFQIAEIAESYRKLYEQ